MANQQSKSKLDPLPALDGSNISDQTLRGTNASKPWSALKSGDTGGQPSDLQQPVDATRKFSSDSGIGNVPTDQAAAKLASQQSINHDALATGNPNIDQVTIKTQTGTENYATQNNGNDITYTDKQGNQYTGNQGPNGQIELTQKNGDGTKVSGQITGSGESAAFGNKGNNQGGIDSTAGKDTSRDTQTSTKAQADSSVESRSTAASKADTGKESFTSAQSQAESSIQSSTRSNQQSGSSEAGDYKSKSSGSAGSDGAATSGGRSQSDTSATTNHSTSGGQGITDGGTSNTSATSLGRTSDNSSVSNTAANIRNEQANISATASGAQARIDAATKTGSLDGQSATTSNAGNRNPDAIPQSTVIPDKNTSGSGAGSDKGPTNQGGSDIGHGVKTTDTPQATPSATPGKGTGGDLGTKGPTGDPKAGADPKAPEKAQPTAPEKPQPTAPEKPQATTPEKPQPTTPEKPQPTTPEKPQPTTPEKPKPTTPEKPQATTPETPQKASANDGAATKGTGADGAAIKGSGTDGAATKGSGADAPPAQGSKPGEKPGEGSGGSGKSEGGDKPQSADKGQASGEKSSMPPTDISQKETRKDLLDTMKAIDGNKLENLPGKDQKFVDSLEAMKKNEPDKYNQLKELLGKESSAQGALGKGDQAAYLGKLNTILSLEKSGTSGLPDGAAMLRGFLNNNKEMLLGTAGSDAQQKAAMVTLAAMIQAMNKANGVIGIPGQTPLQAQDVLAALQNQAKGQLGALDQLLAANKNLASTTTVARDATSATAAANAANAAARGATDASAGTSALAGKGQGLGTGQDIAAFSPTGPGIGKPGDGTAGATTSDSRTPLDGKLAGKEDLTGKAIKPDAAPTKGDPTGTKPGANQGQLTQKGPQTGKPLDPNAPQDGVKPLHPGAPQGGGQFDPLGDGTLLGDKDKKEKDEAEEKQEEDKKKPEPEQRQKYIVQFGDTLESIGAKKLGSSNLAPLIYEINSKVITSWMKNGKRVIDLKPKLVIYLPTTADIEEYNSRPFNSGQEFEYSGNAYKTPEEELAMWENQLRGQVDGLRSEIVNKLGLNDPSSPAGAIGGGLANIGEQTAEAAAAFKLRKSNVEKLLGPLGSQKAEAGGRIKYTVRLGDTLRSIALKHPALQDVKLWRVLAQTNNLPTTTDAKGVPTTAIKRGQTLLIPTVEEIEEFRKIHGIDPNKPLLGSKPATAPSTFDIVTKPCPECESIVKESDTICPKCAHSFVAEAPTLTMDPDAPLKSKFPIPSDSTPQPIPLKVPDATTGGDKRKARSARSVRGKAIAADADTETFVAGAKHIPAATDADTKTFVAGAKNVPAATDADTETFVPGAKNIPAATDANTETFVQESFAPPEESSSSSSTSDDEEDPTTTILRAAGMRTTSTKRPLPPTLFEVAPSRPEKQDPGSATTLFEVVPSKRSRSLPAAEVDEATPADTSEAASANAFIKQMSETCRLVKSNNELYGLKEGDKLCLEINHEEKWIPVVIYEIRDEASKRHEFRLDGQRRTTRIDLPPFAVQELADNDLASNWENYYNRYIAGKPPTD